MKRGSLSESVQSESYESEEEASVATPAPEKKTNVEPKTKVKSYVLPKY